ncbi:carbohydrate ABC transporter permease [Paenibacillus sp. Soil787]|uniref:carbohydrate ABC transporter permease n=1 Tax=Paenibacillus sp. Soil787 TaxID=1736411 RepID=UPI0006FCEBED|nr:carbohydrate ABC transporter permease [Paenibacillus sp. Soil787]KRF39124.1 ABC transporter permease [Paenibacillus sp. Soil787]
MQMTTGEKLFQVLLLVGISLLCIVMMYPFVHELAVSLSSPTEALRQGIHLIPKEFSFGAYKEVFSSKDIWNGMGSSLFRTIIGTVLMVFFMMLGAYPLSKKHLPHRNFYTMFIVFTMFFSGGLIPTYLLVKSLHLVDSRWALIVPCLINTFSMLILRNFFMAIPEELEESAKMDGANDIIVLARIIVPLSLPILATIALWSAVFHWNAWFDSLIYVQDPTKQVLQIYLRKLVVSNEDTSLQTLMNPYVTGESIKAAVIMFVTMPILIVYPFLQKYFVKGVMVGSLKG